MTILTSFCLTSSWARSEDSFKWAVWDSRCRIWFSRWETCSLSIVFSPSRPICPSLSFCNSALSDPLIRSCSCSSPWSWPICPLRADSAWISKCITQFQKTGIRHSESANFILCQVPAVKRYQLTSHCHLLKTSCQPGPSYRVWGQNHWWGDPDSKEGDPWPPKC